MKKSWIDEQLNDLELIPKHSLPGSDQKAMIRAIQSAREALVQLVACQRPCDCTIESGCQMAVAKAAIKQIDGLGK